MIIFNLFYFFYCLLLFFYMGEWVHGRGVHLMPASYTVHDQSLPNRPPALLRTMCKRYSHTYSNKNIGGKKWRIKMVMQKCQHAKLTLNNALSCTDLVSWGCSEMLNLNYTVNWSKDRWFCSLCNVKQIENTNHFVRVCPMLNKSRFTCFKSKSLNNQEFILYLNGKNWQALYKFIIIAGGGYRRFKRGEFNYELRNFIHKSKVI